MPHLFLGTFNESQWTRLKTFLGSRLKTIPARKAHLIAEVSRIGTLQVLYDGGGDPVDFAYSEPTSIGKLFRAYLALGGNPLYDLQVRELSQPVYLLKEDESTQPEKLSTGEILGTAGLGDALSGKVISQIRQPFEGDLKRLDLIRRQILRLVDYRDSLLQEVADLDLYIQAADTAGSFENLCSQVEDMLDDPDFPVVYRDNGSDPYGRLTHAPFAGYDPGPSRPPMDQTVRTSKGVVRRGSDTV